MIHRPSLNADQLKEFRRIVLNKSYGDLPYINSILHRLEDDLENFFNGEEYLNNTDEYRKKVKDALDTLGYVKADISVLYHTLSEMLHKPERRREK